MDDAVKRNISEVLSELIVILKTKEEADIIEIRKISNHTIHTATLFQDGDSISIAIMIYSLSKVMERSLGKVDYDKFLKLLKEAKELLEKDKIPGYRKKVKSVFRGISSMDKKAKLYVEAVINQAQLKKGSKLHEHGVSIGRAAEILGISEWELSNYVGKTNLTDIETIDAVDRLKFARGLFN